MEYNFSNWIGAYKVSVRHTYEGILRISFTSKDRQYGSALQSLLIHVYDNTDKIFKLLRKKLN